MDAMTKAVVYNGEIDFEAQGRHYKVKPLPLKYIVNGEFDKSGLRIPMDKNNLAQGQAWFLTDKSYRDALTKWVPIFLHKEGEPVSFETIVMQDEWDIMDIARFLDAAVQISG